MSCRLGRWLRHPLTRDLDLDDPRTTSLRREILRRKGFLRRVYREWYQGLVSEIPEAGGPVLEVGSGAGFLGEILPELVTSEVFLLPEVRCVLDATDLPFGDGAFRAVLGVNVLHHLERPAGFLAEAARCLRGGGVVALVEPWVTPWSRWVYTRLHHEPFDPEAPGWELTSSGPLSGANGALPWILFHRDRDRFERENPRLEITSVRPMMPLRYLLSGGISLRVSMPEWSFPLWTRLEAGLSRRHPSTAMFAKIVLRRRPIRR